MLQKSVVFINIEVLENYAKPCFDFHLHVFFPPENTNGNCPDQEGTVINEYIINKFLTFTSPMYFVQLYTELVQMGKYKMRFKLNI